MSANLESRSKSGKWKKCNVRFSNLAFVSQKSGHNTRYRWAIGRFYLSQECATDRVYRTTFLKNDSSFWKPADNQLPTLSIMPDLIKFAFIVIFFIVITGTSYSVRDNSYLDTSNPLLTHLPHPLSTSHYFANKSNFLNIHFIKKAWAWTSAVFLFSWITSPPPTRTMGRLLKDCKFKP